MGRDATFDRAVVTEECEGESPRGLPFGALLIALPIRAMLVAALAAITFLLWPPYLVVRLFGGRPPNAIPMRDVIRYLRAIWTARPDHPKVRFTSRLWLTLSISRKFATIPLWGLAWFLDELLYGRKLRETPVSAPLIVISGARSGSTQLGHYLTTDPQLVAPTFLQILFPFLWLWRLAPVTLGRFISKDAVRAKVSRMAPREFLERHEVDPFETDTFEIIFLLGRLNLLSSLLGPELAIREWGASVLNETTRPMWTEDFPEFLDRVGRKTLVYHGVRPGDGRRVFVKGHFLSAAPTLAQRYPDGRFVTVIRSPSSRIRSCVNFLRANEFDPALPPMPWVWAAETTVVTQVDYCDAELDWFTQPDGPRRCVVRFSDYRRDLRGTLQQIYRECFDVVVPEELPTKHAERDRSNYSVNRSLEELGIDEAALDARLASYVEWCEGTEDALKEMR